MAMAFMFVMVTIVIAMHTSQARATRNVTQSEAELQFRQSAEFAAADLMLGATPPPSTLKVKADSELVGDHQMPAKYATKLWTGLPDWDVKADTKFAPGHRTYKLEPDTNDQALQVFAGKYQWMVCHDSGGYAAYAPNGEIVLEEAMGWANPDFLDDRDVAEAYSGVPFLMASKGKLEVQKMPYGNAYSLEGPIDLGDDSKDLALPFQGPLPLRPYETALKTQLGQARTSIEGAATSGDKTNDISGGVLSSVGGVLDMLVSGDPSKLNVSLEQAMGFPFPMIPGFSATIPGVFFEFWFHMPYPPDFYQKESEDDGSGAKSAEEAVELDKKIKALKAEIAALNVKIAAETDDDEKEDLIEQRDDKQDELDDLEDEAESIKDQIQDNSDAMKDNIESNTSQKDEPQTRADDVSIPKTGIVGWAYGKLLSNMLDLLLSIVSGDLEGIAESVVADVRLVHFGRKDNDTDPGFKFDDGFFCEATFTVPRGRTFKYNGKMEVSGDLWLQKGSVMQVTGDLVVSNPEPGSSNPLKPCGKLVIEEGATLIVGGDFECEGDPRFGSMWVCTPPTRVAPVTSAIFVQGTATFPYGSFSATNLEDVAAAIDGMSGVADALESLFTDIAPNLAKIVGPFHERKPYFASYATTFQLTIVPTPVGPIPIPTPIPLPKKNVLIPLFRALTMVYTGTLNVALGENLYTHADWWGFGEGVVPAMIKLNPAGPLNSIKNLNLNGLTPNLDWEDYLTKLTTTVLKSAAEFAIKEVGKKLITTVMASVAPGGSIISTVLDAVLDAVDLKENAFAQFRDEVIDAALGPIVSELEKMRDKIEDEITDSLKAAYLREVGGPLIYADAITVGDPADPPLLMSGMLVAENNISVGTESFVGSLTSFNGNISAGKVYFTPLFTRASLYKPRSTANNALARVVQYEYGNHFDSNEAIDVGTGVWQVTTEGWSR
jgi:hypothetical protein